MEDIKEFLKIIISGILLGILFWLIEILPIFIILTVLSALVKLFTGQVMVLNWSLIISTTISILLLRLITFGFIYKGEDNYDGE